MEKGSWSPKCNSFNFLYVFTNKFSQIYVNVFIVHLFIFPLMRNHTSKCIFGVYVSFKQGQERHRYLVKQYSRECLQECFQKSSGWTQQGGARAQAHAHHPTAEGSEWNREQRKGGFTLGAGASLTVSLDTGTQAFWFGLNQILLSSLTLTSFILS